MIHQLKCRYAVCTLTTSRNLHHITDVTFFLGVTALFLSSAAILLLATSMHKNRAQWQDKSLQ
eukprot:5806106-Amphidinium_carterae.1